MENISLQYIIDTTRWVARHVSGYRFVGSYKEAHKFYEKEDCKDFDVLCSDCQPDTIKPFWKAYEEYSDSHGFMTLQDFYEKVWKHRAA